MLMLAISESRKIVINRKGVYPQNKPYLGTSVVDCRWENTPDGNFPLKARQTFNVYF